MLMLFSNEIIISFCTAVMHILCSFLLNCPLVSCGIITLMRGHSGVVRCHSAVFFGMVEKSSLFSLLFPLKSNPGVQIETEEWNYKNLVKDKSAKDKKDESNKLKNLEGLKVTSIDRYDHEKEPD